MAQIENEEDFGVDILTLLDEDGLEHSFEVADALDLGGNRYMALVPVMEDADDVMDYDGELVILKVVDDEKDGEGYLEAIEDEAEFNQVATIFMERLEEDYDFQD